MLIFQPLFRSGKYLIVYQIVLCENALNVSISDEVGHYKGLRPSVSICASYICVAQLVFTVAN